MQNLIRLVYLMRILLHLSTYFTNTPRISRSQNFYARLELTKASCTIFMKLEDKF